MGSWCFFFQFLLIKLQGSCHNFEYTVTQQKKDNSRNVISLDISTDSKPYTFINLIASNDDNPDFFDSISDIISEFDNSRVLVVGDNNLVFYPHMDYHNYLHVNNPILRLT